jgi:protein-S-isoprenylcysteine O-methyltransferase Ste14
MRHPIYASMLGMLFATGLVVSRWEALIAAMVFCMIGTMIRVKAEEKLLMEKFGQAYEEYAKEVPVLFPRIGWPNY